MIVDECEVYKNIRFFFFLSFLPYVIFRKRIKIHEWVKTLLRIFFLLFFRYYYTKQENPSCVMSSELCAICGPKRISRALCNCCKQYLCREHLQEHDDLLNGQVEPLADNINQLVDRLQHFNINSSIQPVRFRLDQWKQSAFQSIENIYQQKLNEINQFFNKELENLRQQTEKIQKNVLELIREQNATNEQIEYFISTLQNIEKQINYFENESIDINIQPLIVNENLIYFNLEKPVVVAVDDDDNNELILSPVIEKLSSTQNNCDCIASNDTYILLHRHPILCLYDKNFNLIKQTYPYTDLILIDISWISTLNRFAILTNDDVFILNEINMILEKSNIPRRTNGHWHNITCSLNSIYLTAYKWGTVIYKYSIQSFELDQRWKTPLTCSTDETIDHFIHNQKNHLVMIIQNRLNYEKYFQLKNDQTLQIIWSIQLDQFTMKIQRNKVCLINQNQFLIINSDQSQFIIFSSNGLFKQIINYQFNQPLNALQIKSNLLFVTTNQSINLHQIQIK